MAVFFQSASSTNAEKNLTTGERVAKAFLGTSADRTGKALAVFIPDQSGATVATPTSKKATPTPQQPAGRTQPSKGPGDLQVKLQTLKDAYDQGLITKQEYDSKRKTLLDKY